MLRGYIMGGSYLFCRFRDKPLGDEGGRDHVITPDARHKFPDLAGRECQFINGYPLVPLSMLHSLLICQLYPFQGGTGRGGTYLVIADLRLLQGAVPYVELVFIHYFWRFCVLRTPVYPQGSRCTYAYPNGRTFPPQHPGYAHSYSAVPPLLSKAGCVLRCNYQCIVAQSILVAVLPLYLMDNFENLLFLAFVLLIVYF